MTGDDNSVKEEVLTYLDSIKGINVANGKLAIWLSNEKTDNLQTIANPDDITEVLLFKQAIALGWDCPRAAVLLIFRKIESFTFSAQTVGRILRMPEQRFYQNDMLNRGYVYTNLSKDIIEIVKDDNRPIFVAEDDGVVIGYAFCVITDRKDDNVLTDMKNLYIDDLCVDENMRDKHIGTVIYDYVKKYAKEIGCYNLTLNVWSCNESAQKFYERQGLKPQKTTMETIL